MANRFCPSFVKECRFNPMEQNNTSQIVYTMKSTAVFFWALLSALPQTTHAQYAEGERGALFARLGIRRMVVNETHYARQTSVTNRIAGSNSNRETETFFDSLGRTVLFLNSDCPECETVFEYDSLSGKLAYEYKLQANKHYSETYHEYDARGRNTLSETCSDGRDETCKTSIYKYEGDTICRRYAVVERLHLRFNTQRNSDDFLRLRSNEEEELELQKEDFYHPDGKLRETKTYKKSAWSSTTRYVYDDKGLLIEEYWTNQLHAQKISEYVYDEHGRRTETWIRENAKRKWLQNEVVYNKQGRIEEARMYNDPEMTPPGIPKVFSTTYTYDADGLLVRLETDNSLLQYFYFKD